MRSWPLAVAILASLVLAASLTPAFASKPAPMTVQQLQEAVTAAHASNQSDDALARQLANVRLTARLTGDTLQKLLALSPGPKSTQSLDAVAGLSTFLDPPASDLPSTPAPSLATQKAMMARTVNYAVHALPTLPNFLASRMTRQYVDNMRGIDLVSENRGELFWIGDHHSTVAFRDGRESDDPNLKASQSSQKRNRAAADSTSPPTLNGMTSWGEFGPILGLVLLDAAKGKLSWQRWQTEDGKPVAVFQFSVDRAISHYELHYCCEESSGPDLALSNIAGNTSKTVAIKPGYHGSFEIDPQTGNILRITVVADPQQQDAISHASMMVEYGPVKIGDDTRFCPLRSVSLSQSRATYQSHGALIFADRRFLNDVEFTNYHRFGSESTLLIASADGKSANPDPGATPLEADSAPAPAAPEEDSAETQRPLPNLPPHSLHPHLPPSRKSPSFPPPACPAWTPIQPLRPRQPTPARPDSLSRPPLALSI